MSAPRKEKLKPNDHLFYAEATKGFIPKVLIDVISPLGRGIFSLTRKGIFLTQMDEAGTILFDVKLPREKFKQYVCKEEKTISFNLSHAKNLLKNVKKKDSLILSIKYQSQSQLYMTIKPEVAKIPMRTETVNIVYKEEIDYVPVDPPEDGYKYPMVISAPDFQKIKRQITMGGKSIKVIIQGSNYLCFSCNAGEVYGTDLECGEWIDPKSKDDSGEEVDIEYSEDLEIFNVYESTFSASIFNMLLKLPGLCTQMKFYAPTIPNYPLRIDIDAAQQSCVLGHINIYIKNESVIAYENQNSDRPKPRKKSKK